MPTQELIDAQSEPAPGHGGHLLEVQGLHVEFHTRDGVAKAINGVDLYLDEGETLAVLGESGSGKSVTAPAVMGLLDMPPGGSRRVACCSVAATCCSWRPRSGADQGAGDRDDLPGRAAALNPVFPVGWQIAETVPRPAARTAPRPRPRAWPLLERVGIPIRQAGATTIPTSSPAACGSG